MNATIGMAAKSPMTPNKRGPGGQGDEHQGGMDLDGPLVDERGQELALDEAQDPDQDRQDERGRGPARWPAPRGSG